MCFGIRISSPFHLDSLNIPIQNIKCPKNTKNACADIISPPAIICEAWTENIQLKQLIDYAYLWVPILDVQGPCWVPMPSKIGSLSGPYFKDRLPWLKKRPRSFRRGTYDNIVMSAHALLVLLGHLIFWMGMFKVFRWNPLEILIPKHMWKSKIGPLEQI